MTLLSEPVLFTPRRPPEAEPGIDERGPELLPLDAGEQYRFSFDMNACVGCHSCEVACAEQNDLPVDIAWRRVGELEGGAFPEVRRFNLSMACNHCLEPTCLSGCPTNAYTKLDNGIVAHDADECIGCQYCIWNCPYEVPVYDKARRIVSKCDMCLPRLEAGQSPACVQSCPTKAIGVEKVDVAAWRADHEAADAPGLPPAFITLSTTRVVKPVFVPAETRAVTDSRVTPEDPHWPLVALTLLTQLSLGTVAATVATQLATSGAREPLARGALAALVAGAVALAASLLHLGRPDQGGQGAPKPAALMAQPRGRPVPRVLGAVVRLRRPVARARGVDGPGRGRGCGRRGGRGGGRLRQRAHLPRTGPPGVELEADARLLLRHRPGDRPARGPAGDGCRPAGPGLGDRARRRRQGSACWCSWAWPVT